jgi:glutamate--cysteine ligase
VAGLWTAAARHGLTHPGLAGAARSCFEIALELGADAGSYYERYVARGRSPADDRLSEFADTGALYPTDETVEAS